ncbi:hypothetical protein [Labilibaculum sp.]|uniref:hypothetical protein n=1 Tax=Labilibaculum sp. TaxID=2060723 RepID=UPI002AA7AE40|nr:hypothetical protein [Labilibaculum sp.]
MLYLDCINSDYPAVLTVFVDQPAANSNDTYDLWSGTAVHTFIGIIQNGNTSIVGFYPEGAAKPSSKIHVSVLNNDEGHDYDVSISMNIAKDKLGIILNYIKNPPLVYNLDTYNCTDFAIDVANKCGMNLPDTEGTWPNGSGTNPGCLGQDIRNMSTTDIISIDPVGGKAPANVKSCNP